MTLLAAGVRRFNLGRSRRIDGVTGETVLVTLSVVVILMLIAFVAVPGVVAPKSPIALDILHRLQPPSFTHPFGTDEGGRDVFARVVHGARYSLGVSIATVLCAAVFGVLYGALSGMGPRWLDNILMRIVDVFFGFPAWSWRSPWRPRWAAVCSASRSRSAPSGGRASPGSCAGRCSASASGPMSRPRGRSASRLPPSCDGISCLS